MFVVVLGERSILDLGLGGKVCGGAEGWVFRGMEWVVLAFILLLPHMGYE